MKTYFLLAMLCISFCCKAQTATNFSTKIEINGIKLGYSYTIEELKKILGTPTRCYTWGEAGEEDSQRQTRHGHLPFLPHRYRQSLPGHRGGCPERRKKTRGIKLNCSLQHWRGSAQRLPLEGKLSKIYDF